MIITSRQLNTNNIFNYILIILLVISALISDWVVGPVSISDFFIGLIVVLIILHDNEILRILRYRWFLIIMVLLLFHGLYHYFYNDEFIVKLFIYSFVKVFMYAISIKVMYIYITKNKLEHTTLIFLNVGALVAIILGIYITISIVMNDNMPYEFLWTFTRTKHFSYVYKEFSNIIRTRSIFSEPAHLGYFLNVILGLNFFGRTKKIPVIFSVLIILGVGLTLSYASIGVTLILIGIKGLTLIKNKSYRSINNYYYLLIIPIVLLIIIFYEYIEITIINRTLEIFSGTDRSAFNRLFSSWSYVDKESIFFGNGIAHTPPIQNVYAYFLSDFGIFGLLLSLLVTIKLLTLNTGLGILFILLNFQKGGYLSPIFMVLLVLLSLYAVDNNKTIKDKIKLT